MELDAKACDRARLARDPRFDGRFFIAVLSTGVYCRPICPSPTAKRANVRFYKSAAEAVAAGFRPCLRCRPETAPGTPAWYGTSATVARALRLITEGAYLTQSIAELSRRLGISPRHLDRLFTSHLGASPKAVLRTWRTHFALELIRDTDLPMALVAQAAGFGSVRRFNDAIRAVHGRTPTALRKMRPPALRAGRDEYVFRISYRPPFDWEWLLEYLAARAIPGVEQVASGAYRRTFVHEGRHGVLEVRRPPDANALDVRLRFSETLSLLPIVSRLRGMFDVASDAPVIAEHLARDPRLEPLVRRWPAPRVPGAWDGFELAVRAILGEHETPETAAEAAGAIARRFGERLAFSDPGDLAFVFPPAAVIADAHLPDLSEPRARAIRALARSVDSGGVTLRPGDPVEALAALPGVGETTAQYVAMRALRDPDAFPSADLVLPGPAGALRGAALLERAERWRPWRGYAAVYLWRTADAGAARVPDANAGGVSPLAGEAVRA